LLKPANAGAQGGIEKARDKLPLVILVEVSGIEPLAF
jgi:hypothetical protein